MANRYIKLYATCELTPAFNHADTSYIKAAIQTALYNEGFNFTNIAVNYSASSLSFSNVFQVTIEGVADSIYSDEAIRQRLTQVISAIPVATNYLIFSTAPYPLFSAVSVQVIVSGKVTDTRTQINQSGVSDTQSAIKNLGLDNFLTGAGLTTPVVIGGLLVLTVLYLRK